VKLALGWLVGIVVGLIIVRIISRYNAKHWK
jgi:uncharacterized membrane-anchored protein YhcB (DUF1043 family)